MRIKEIDIARGFTVLIMPAVHVLMINSTPSRKLRYWEQSSAFLPRDPAHNYSCC